VADNNVEGDCKTTQILYCKTGGDVTCKSLCAAKCATTAAQCETACNMAMTSVSAPCQSKFKAILQCANNATVDCSFGAPPASCKAEGDALNACEATSMDGGADGGADSGADSGASCDPSTGGFRAGCSAPYTCNAKTKLCVPETPCTMDGQCSDGFTCNTSFMACDRHCANTGGMPYDAKCQTGMCNSNFECQ
jgi:hypothetical protein